MPVSSNVRHHKFPRIARHQREDMNAHVLDGYQVTVTELTTPDGKPLPAIDFTIITRQDPDNPELTRWPTIRIRPRDIPDLLNMLQVAHEKALRQDYSGPGQVQ